jgi:protein gp37
MNTANRMAPSSPSTAKNTAALGCMAAAAFGIEWTDTTWNPVRGCSKVSPGCQNCYAERTAARQAHSGYAGLVRIGEGSPRWTGEVRLVPGKLDEPRRWRKPRRIFVNSMSDLFHEKLTDAEIARVFDAMRLAPQHTYQVLTKRAGRMRDALPGWFIEQPLPNVWLGVSVENQAAADERIPRLLATPAAVRFLSCEPLLGPVDLSYWIDEDKNGFLWRTGSALQWVIVGGESGPSARGCDIAWLRSIAQQCKANDVPVFVKQVGSVPFFVLDGAVREYNMMSRDLKGGKLDSLPADLRVREFPPRSP